MHKKVSEIPLFFSQINSGVFLERVFRWCYNKIREKGEKLWQKRP